MYAYEISNWIGFLTVAAGVMATLTGLIFVAVSINLTRILEVRGVSDRAAEAILQLLGVLVICMIALEPRQSTAILGPEITASGLIIWMFMTRLQYRAAASDQKRPLISTATSHLVPLMFVVAGMSLTVGAFGGLYWLSAGIIYSMTIGVSNAWVLLVEILR
ncbi:MAG: hypothetical protein WAM05_14500 [Candidatus Binataceae bacterium]